MDFAVKENKFVSSVHQQTHVENLVSNKTQKRE